MDPYNDEFWLFPMTNYLKAASLYFDTKATLFPHS